MPDLTPGTIVVRRRMLQMGIPPVQIRVMSVINGIEWDEAWSDCETGPLGRRTVRGRAAFLRNKKAAGRPKDIADIDVPEPVRAEQA